jgi:flagellar hook-associated protein 2
VASGGSLTIGGVAVTVAAGVTLQGLSDQINHTAGIGVTASVIQSAPGTFRLVLSGKEPGAANAFTVANSLTGGSGLGFVDTDNDGLSGNSSDDNAVSASNATLTVNNIPVSATTNTLTDVIAGVTLTLNQQDPASTISVTVGRDDDDLTTRVKSFISAYNDLVAFTNSQRTAAAGGASGTLARDPVLSGVRNQLRDALLGAYSGGLYGHLSEIGIGPDRTGLLTLDSTTFAAAVAANPSEVAHLFTGSNNDGAFAAVHTLVTQYTQSGGFIPSATTQLTDELTRVGSSIASMQARLAIRRLALQREFTAADAAMAQLKSQSSSLSAFGASLNS